jgi:hypothetical protein
MVAESPAAGSIAMTALARKEVRAERARLRSRIRILQRAKERTRSYVCLELYRKAIQVAQFEILQLIS